MAVAPVLLWATVASTAITAYSAYQQGQTAKKTADYNSQVAGQNAEINRKAAAAQALQDQRAAILRLGSIRAASGASGLTMGSALDVLGDVASQSELQRQQTLYQGELRSRADTQTATMESFSGAAASRAGAVKAGSSLLEGGAATYKAYRDLNPQ